MERSLLSTNTPAERKQKYFLAYAVPIFIRSNLQISLAIHLKFFTSFFYLSGNWFLMFKAFKHNKYRRDFIDL